jgi:hypothetical protein
MTMMALQRLARFAGTSTTTTTAATAVRQLQRHSFPALTSTLTSTLTLTLTSSTDNGNNNEQRRTFWMDVIRIKTNRPQKYSKDGKSGVGKQHEDPEQVIRRHMDETRSDGESLLDLMFFNDKHEKKWMKRVRLQSKKRYEFDKKHVTDLAKYIAFVQKGGGEK